MNDRLNKNLLGKIPPGVFGEMRFSERATRTERNPRQRRSPPAEGRPRAIHNPPTRHPHPRVSDTSRIVDGGNPRKNTIPRSRVPITWHLRSRTLPSALSSDIGCHNCCWTPVPSQPSPVRPGGTLPRAREPRARIQPPHPRLTPNLLREDSAPTPRLEQKVWRGNDYHPGPPKPVQTVADEVSAEHPPSAVDKQVFNALSNTECRAMTCTGGRPETDGQEQNSTGCMDDPSTSSHVETTGGPPEGWLMLSMSGPRSFRAGLPGPHQMSPMFALRTSPSLLSSASVCTSTAAQSVRLSGWGTMSGRPSDDSHPGWFTDVVPKFIKP